MRTIPTISNFKKLTVNAQGAYWQIINIEVLIYHRKACVHRIEMAVTSIAHKVC